MLWNANNTYGFDRIDWDALRRAATVTTISKYMKFELGLWGVGSLVIPNGIAEELLEGPPRELVKLFRSVLRGKPSLMKVGRFDPDKNWLTAVDAVAELRAAGVTVEVDAAPEVDVEQIDLSERGRLTHGGELSDFGHC